MFLFRKVKNENAVKGSWWINVRRKIEIVLVCPKCENLNVLNNHLIGKDGVISPKLFCDCGWADSGRLLNYAYN